MDRVARILGSLLACVLATGALAQSVTRIDDVRPDAPVLSAYGDFPVGVRTLVTAFPDRVDVLAARTNGLKTYDRPVTLEVWYPAAEDTEQGTTYNATLRDGQTQVALSGRAARGAKPASGTRFPLIVLSHGYPGNRYLMSHIGENLASKGYVVASIDHADSTYSDQAAFGSTLYNRPLDQTGVIDILEQDDGPLGAITDTSSAGIVGYSMGGYGALVQGGAGLVETAKEFAFAPPQELLDIYRAGSETHEDLIDPRVRAILAIGPWGMNAGLWDSAGLAGLRVPTLIMAGSADEVSVYAAMREIFEMTSGTDRYLLTFEAAGHNAAAPIPAPEESRQPVETLDFIPFDHYADPVWDTVRMNNIAQHFATAFFDLHLKEDVERRSYLDLVEDADTGVYSVDDAGLPTPDHTYWKGFANRTARGLRLEARQKGE